MLICINQSLVGEKIQLANEIKQYNIFLHKGYCYDNGIRLYYLNSRYYDPQIGRFISPDVILYLDSSTIGGVNLYAYCGNKPIMYFDSDGTILKSVLGDIGRFIGGVISNVIGAVAIIITAPLALRPGVSFVPQFCFSKIMYNIYDCSS